MLLFLYGQDGYRSFQKLQDLKARYIDASLGDTNLSQLDVARCSVDELTNTLLALPFLAKTRLVVLNRLLSQGSKSVQEAFVDLMGKLPETTVAVIYESGVPDRRTVLFKTLLKVAKVQEFVSLGGKSLQDWMASELATIQSGPKIPLDPPLQKGEETGTPLFHKEGLGEIFGSPIMIAPAAASRLAVLTSNDTWRMATELRKLAMAALGRDETTISPELVSELVIDGQTNDVFALGDALTRTNPAEALSALRQLIDQGENLQQLVALVANTFRTLALVREALDSGHMSPSSIASTAGLAPFVVSKHLAAARRLTTGEISHLLEQLAQLDLDSKRGKIDAAVGLELFALKTITQTR